MTNKRFTKKTTTTKAPRRAYHHVYDQGYAAGKRAMIRQIRSVLSIRDPF